MGTIVKRKGAVDESGAAFARTDGIVSLVQESVCGFTIADGFPALSVLELSAEANHYDLLSYVGGLSQWMQAAGKIPKV